jgi:biotin operon repressor
MTEERVLQLFKCLADRSRLRIVQALLQEEMYTERLAQRLALTPATISFHLKKLEEAGLVASRGEQYYTMYTLRREGLTLPVLELIGSATDQHSQQELREQQYRQKVIEAFFEYGRLRAIPAQRKKERICLEEIAKALEPGRVYSEAELNGVLLTFHEDYCTLRRDMIAEGLLKRDGSRYEKL